MASFVPTNLIVTVGLLLPNPTTAGIIFWQWANQSCNVAINWANANKSVPMSLQETGFAYGCAVFASVSMALGLTALVKRSKFSPATASILNKCVPFASVATASSLNVMLMRGKEIVEGIHVYDKDGNIVGKSKVAGAHAIGQVAVSRVLTAFPALLLPPMILSVLEKKSFLKNNPRLFIPINAALVAASLLTALPAAIAVFPQRSPISIEKLESEFKTLTKERQLYFNKGL
ncbi:Tricarboxylate/iron carrier [Neoconidiobolus thromboides FSU 785]|nr:Tricarboxylate/iron carrier [Neoconidiobolus thromboides FSU 785]